jgi:hypothetical protein
MFSLKAACMLGGMSLSMNLLPPDLRRYKSRSQSIQLEKGARTKPTKRDPRVVSLGLNTVTHNGGH